MTSTNLQNLSNSEKFSKPSGFQNNLYQYIRTIRFRSNPPAQQSNCFEERLNKAASIEESFNLSEFSKELNKIKENLENVFCCKTSENNQKEKIRENSSNDNMRSKQNNTKFNKGISVKLSWLKKYHKDTFYLLIKDINNKQKKWSLHSDLKNIHIDFKDNFNCLKEAVKQIKAFSKAPKEQQKRYSDISHSIKQLRATLPYFINFLEESHTSKPNFDRQISDTIKRYKSLQLETAEQCYLSNENSGVAISKASFNYYTVNKKQKDYEKEIKETENKLNRQSHTSLKNKEGNIEWIKKNNSSQYNHTDKKSQIIFEFQSGLEKEWIKRYYFKNIKCYDQNAKNCGQEFVKNYEKYRMQIESDLKEGFSISLNQTYSMMKAFKAEQKSIFYEIMNHISEKKNSKYKVSNKNHLLYGNEISFGELSHVNKLNRLFSLFQFRDHKFQNKRYNCNSREQWYNSFIRFSKRLSHIKGDAEKSQKIKKERGNFLFRKDCYFKEYGKFCESYKRIAQERGKLTAQQKGLEKEKLESSQINYWSFIYIENNHRQLWLVPKDCIKDAKEFIYDTHERTNYSKGDTKYLCCFESLTMRALNKLCFSEKSTFIEDKDIPSDLKYLQKDAKIFKTEGDSEKMKEKNEKKLQFFKKLLKSDYFDISKGNENKGLDVTNFNLDWIDSVSSIEEFEKHLEQSCYFIKTIKFSNDEKNIFLKNHHVTVLDITSYDLEERNKKHNPASPNRIHTNLWNFFWKNTKLNHKPETTEKNMEENLHNSIRLNPEVKIYYRKFDDELKKYFNKRRFPENFKHRKKQNQITIAFTLNLNAEGRHEDLAFTKPEEIGKKIDDFNKELNEQLNFETAWKFGIDRGQNELATLCISRINQNNNEPEFGKFEHLTLKDYKYSEEYQTKSGQNKTREAIRNLSYFIDNKSLFQKNRTSCLDLTTAKVIKGNLISNGDVMTYLKLKKESAKRKLYDLYGNGDIKKGEKLNWSHYINGDKNKYSSDGVLNIRIHDNKEETIYHYYKKYEDVLLQKEIENSLNSYLKNLLDSKHSKHTPSVEKINHLRDAITSNMVGVIFHLQKQYPGFIVLEDLDEYNIHKHFSDNNENISRRLEYALYNKFQTLSLVPPHVKNIVQLREKLRETQKNEKGKKDNLIQSSQIGTIIFVDKQDTSKTCPSPPCKNQTNKNDKLKYEQKRFRCVHCNFDTYLFKPKEERTPNHKPEVKIEDKKKFELFKDLDDPDKVAAYNIAIKITDPIEIGKWTQMKNHCNKPK